MSSPAPPWRVRLASWSCLVGLVAGPACLPLDELSDHEGEVVVVDSELPSDADGAVTEAMPSGEDVPGESEAPAAAALDDAVADDGSAGASNAANEPEANEPDANGADATPAGADELAAPRLLESVPADGAIGVATDAELRLRFSQPMDTLSVEAAFQSDALISLGLDFAWSADDTEVVVSLAAPLESALGDDPQQLAPLRYAFTLGGALDREGRALPETSVRFATIRRIETSLPAVASADATGNWRSDGSYGTDGCAEAGNLFCVGDSSLAENERYYGFLTFDVSGLGAAELSGADLDLDVVNVLGSPFADLGALQLEQVRFTGIGPAAFSEPAVLLTGAATSAAAGDALSADVTAALRAELDVGGTAFQVRLRFQVATDGDASTDLVVFDRQTPSLAVRYAIP